MFRKVLFGLVAVLGLTFLGTSSADAGWRRAYRNGYYAAPYNGGYYAPRRVYRQPYYAPVYNYGYNSGYYGGGYYGGPYNSGVYYGPGVGVYTPGFGVYVR